MLPDLIPAVKGVINQCDLQLVTRYILTLMQLPPGSKIAPPSIVKVASHEVMENYGFCDWEVSDRLLVNPPYKLSNVGIFWKNIFTSKNIFFHFFFTVFLSLVMSFSLV